MSFFRKKKSSQSSRECQLRQFVFIEAPIDIVASLALDWGQAIWWPKESKMKYRSAQEMPLQVGKPYTVRIPKPWTVGWSAEVSQYVPQRLVVHQFTAGLLSGSEKISVEERSNGTRLEYEIRYAIRDPIPRLLWNVLYAKGQSRWIEAILRTIKEFSEKIYQERRETV